MRTRAAGPWTWARAALVVSGALLALALLLALAASYGASGVGLGALRDGRAWSDPAVRAILFSVRLPRVALAAVLGGALAVAGLAFQALLRNPLADPYVIGVSGGASLGGVLALLAGWGRFGSVVLPLAALAGALGALTLIQWIASAGGRLAVGTLLLTGAVFNAFAAALIFFLESVASLEELHAMVFYLMGRIPALAWREIGALAGVTLAASAVLLASARDFNALGLGEEGAAALGVDVERLKRRAFFAASLLTAVAVAFAGLIGFVGLVVPHLLRLLFGADHRLLVPLALLCGGGFLVLADLLARTLLAPNELPVGVVTALVGGPFFLVLLRRRQGAYGG
ncbi:MAG: iron ABC transporter permease [Thermoanaerobaculia bacterium]